MTPESFNAALAQRKLEAADILLKQAKTGSDADRIRAASAILRMAFVPVRATDPLSSAGQCSTQETTGSPRAPRKADHTDASQAESLQESSRRNSDESGGARSAAPGNPPNPAPAPQGSYSPASPPLSLPGGVGEGRGEGVTTLCPPVTDISRGIPAPALFSA